MSLSRAVRVVSVMAALACVALLVWALLDAFRYPVESLATRVPSRTSLMRTREAQAQRAGRPHAIRQRWLGYERLSPLLRRAVLIAEDDAFFAHGGLDWNELRVSARANLEARKVVRGGSTITQQLARNLYLSDQRTLTRKLTEMVLAWRLERALSKRRIFELYLNLIEWGDGVYGADAAARHWFGHSASELTPREATALAAVIINPRRFSPVAPSKRIERRIRMIARRLERRGALTAEQTNQALGLPPAERPDAAPADSMELSPPEPMPAAEPALDSAGLSPPELP
ncbi:MAG: monofunctional biosynthetic peptidoglycan transglycosylase [Candidatus Eisenbacteria bacterium]|uniref:Biosynthetic peptidoglycan transglycosylase n=1 Tax=Eiseniibacteriota bacterium TaxID=2212470 RepID=A0A849SS37_UNCEI|nr:monofunctional biosynthetic peptidoglycan transglycosylase [Candidatus Eisenbacteria bacterium]